MAQASMHSRNYQKHAISSQGMAKSVWVLAWTYYSLLTHVIVACLRDRFVTGGGVKLLIREIVLAESLS